jgi:hypothetical protein
LLVAFFPVLFGIVLANLTIFTVACWCEEGCGTLTACYFDSLAVPWLALERSQRSNALAGFVDAFLVASSRVSNIQQSGAFALQQ